MFEFKKFAIRCRAIIINEGKLLVVRHGKDVDFCALPGGHLEWGEDIKKCLQREIVEELGVNPKIGRLLYVNDFIDTENTHSVEFFFEILNSSDFKNIENKVRTHAHEIYELCWVGPEDSISILPKDLLKDFKRGEILSDQVRCVHN